MGSRTHGCRLPSDPRPAVFLAAGPRLSAPLLLLVFGPDRPTKRCRDRVLLKRDGRARVCLCRSFLNLLGTMFVMSLSHCGQPSSSLASLLGALSHVSPRTVASRRRHCRRGPKTREPDHLPDATEFPAAGLARPGDGSGRDRAGGNPKITSFPYITSSPSPFLPSLSLFPNEHVHHGHHPPHSTLFGPSRQLPPLPTHPPRSTGPRPIRPPRVAHRWHPDHQPRRCDGRPGRRLPRGRRRR